MAQTIYTQIAIIGAGPAGLFLSHLLHISGIDSIVLESRSKARVESRVRAGQLEPATVRYLTEAGVGARLVAEGLAHEGVSFHYNGTSHRLDLKELTGRSVTIYGQREIVRDLIRERLAAAGRILFEASNVAIHNFDSSNPSIVFHHGNEDYVLNCDFIAGCDGFHGISRPALASKCSTFNATDSLGWLGILAEAPPISPELLYSCHDRGLALFSMRSKTISRLYLQCAADENMDLWPDDRIWGELKLRLDGRAPELKLGPILEKGVVQLRSYVVAPMQCGRLFLAGDAAHIVPPSAAKGLNLAMGDVHLLAKAFERYFKAKDERLLRNYSDEALIRVWEGQRFSQWMTRVLHRFANDTPLERRLQLAEFDNIFRSSNAARAFAECYVGTP